MKKSTHGGKRTGAGRPATGRAPMRAIRMGDPLYKRVMDWGKKRADKLGFAESARRLIRRGLGDKID